MLGTPNIVAQRDIKVNSYTINLGAVKHKKPLWNKGFLCFIH